MAKKSRAEIRNKSIRSLMYQKLKKEKNKTKKKTRKENEGKPKQIPKTIENCRAGDETFVYDLQNDPELQLDLRTDEISTHLNRKPAKPVEKEDSSEDNDEDTDEEEDSGNETLKSEKIKKTKETKDEEEEVGADENEDEFDEEDEEKNEDEFDEEDEENKEPKILITTHEIKIAFKTYKLCRELAKILPNGHFFYRKNVPLKKIIPEAIRRDYSAMIVINEDRRVPNGMIISLLPEGPTMNFKLTNVKLSDEIKNGGGFTKHKPEIILNNFNTRLGLQVGRSFAALFPHNPQYAGRHCITFHNQRDYIFLRHHRYIFRNAQKVGIQELGPRFTLKLRSLQKGTFDTKFGQYEWIHKRHDMDASRRKFSL